MLYYFIILLLLYFVCIFIFHSMYFFLRLTCAHLVWSPQSLDFLCEFKDVWYEARGRGRGVGCVIPFERRLFDYTDGSKMNIGLPTKPNQTRDPGIFVYAYYTCPCVHTVHTEHIITISVLLSLYLYPLPEYRIVCLDCIASILECIITSASLPANTRSVGRSVAR